MSVRIVKGGRRQPSSYPDGGVSVALVIVDDAGINEESGGVVQFKRHVGVGLGSSSARISNASGSSNSSTSSSPSGIPCAVICKLRVERYNAIARLSERNHSAILKTGGGIVSGPDSDSEHCLPERKSRLLGNIKKELMSSKGKSFAFF